MTVVVAFLCSDGVVVAADSMLTPSVGQIRVGHHKGRKTHVLSGQQVCGIAGDIGLGARFRTLADANANIVGTVAHPLDYGLTLSQSIISQFKKTAIDVNNMDFATVLGFPCHGMPQCCVYMNKAQPWLLDVDHYYVALGSGKLSADPFLRFLVDIFCHSGQPTAREAIFLATWAIQHVIDTAAGGVAGPIRIAVIERGDAGEYSAREVPENEVEEHHQAIESAAAALRSWRDELQSGDAAEGVPEPPEPPQNSGQCHDPAP